MSFRRHTMGHDYPISRRLNPVDAPKITETDLLKFAKSMGEDIRREGHGMWFVWDRESELWKTLGMTNFLALQQLKRITGG